MQPKLKLTMETGKASLPANPPTTFWEVEAELEQFGIKSRIHGIKPGRFEALKKRDSVYGKPIAGRGDQLAEHFQNRDIVSH